MVCVSPKCYRMPKMIKAIARTESKRIMKISLLNFQSINVYWNPKQKTKNQKKFFQILFQDNVYIQSMLAMRRIIFQV